MCKAQGYFVGGRRGFNMIDGKKVPNEAEQKLIEEMKAMRSTGQGLLVDAGIVASWISLRCSFRRFPKSCYVH